MALVRVVATFLDSWFLSSVTVKTNQFLFSVVLWWYGKFQTVPFEFCGTKGKKFEVRTFS